MSINSKFPFLLTDETTTCTTTKYLLTSNNISAFSGKFLFDYLEWDLKSDCFRSANINYFNKDGTAINDYPIDLIVNSSALTSISSFYNENTDYIFSTGNIFSQLLNHENLFKVIRYLRTTTQYGANFIKSCSESSTDLLKQNKFYELYNDKDGDEYYATNIYRARQSKSCAVTNKILNKIIPIFSATTEYDSLMAYIKIRNIKIPMKRVLVGKSESDNKIYYNFIFIYPEYILKKYSQYMNSIQKIEFTNDVNEVLYSTLTDSDGKEYLYTFDDTYDVLGETFSSKSLSYSSNATLTA